jgi:hypothetical protein
MTDELHFMTDEIHFMTEPTIDLDGLNDPQSLPE